MIFFVLNFYINTVMSIFAIFIGAKGLYKIGLIYIYIQASTNLILSIVLVNYFGINGVLMGTLIGNLVGLVYPKIKIVYRYILNLKEQEIIIYFIKIFVFVFFYLNITLMIKRELDKFIKIDGIYYFISSILIYIIVSSIFLIPFFLIFKETRIFTVNTLRKLFSFRF
jgi:hypothetical protein